MQCLAISMTTGTLKGKTTVYAVHIYPSHFVHSDIYLSHIASACNLDIQFGKILSVNYKCLLLNKPIYLEII